MATYSFLQRVVRLVGIALAAGALVAAPALLPAVRLQASTSAAADPGTIAYVQMSTQDIHTISPDGAGDRLLWTNPEVSGINSVLYLAWRPDGRELAFTSGHEQTCSWYESDVYAIGYDGAGYRRITNSPACAALAGLPKGAVKFHVINWVGDSLWVYVQGAPAPKLVPASYDEMVTFDDVADLGPGVLQPTVGITGLYRYPGGQPYADVQPGQTASGGSVIRTSAGGGSRGFGAGKVSWKADGSALAYGMRTNKAIRQIPAVPPYGFTGVDLPVVEKASPRLVAWGTTPATKDQYLYSSDWHLLEKDVGGIYLNTVGNASGGTQLVIIPDYSGQYAHDIEWLPDGSGFLFALRFTQFPPDPPGTYSDIFEYNFASQVITRLTSLRDDSDAGGARGLSISPDGQQIVFERAVYPDDSPSSVWIINSDGTGLHKLADDAGRPAWGQIPGQPTPTPTATSIATDTPTPTPTLTKTLTRTPTPTDTQSPTPSPTGTVALPTHTRTPTPTQTLTLAPTHTATATQSPTPSGTLTLTPTPTPTPASTLPGDLDGDCDVDVVDIMLVASRWGAIQGQPQYDAHYDLDLDGDIDIVDIMRVAAQWNTQCAPTPTPTRTAIPTETVTPTATPTVTSTPAATPGETATPTPTPTQTPTPTMTPGWVEVVSEGFEDAFPAAGWERWSSGGYGWLARDCQAHSGDKSAWSVGQVGVADELPCGSDYPIDVTTLLVYGPFSLEGATAATLTFWTWSLTEDGYDTCFFGASIDGENFGGTQFSGQSDDWAMLELDFTAVPLLGNLLGSAQVWIGFRFDSDHTVTRAHGWYVDDVRITELVGGAGADVPGAGGKTTDAGEPVLMRLRR